jgi:hypothetical protein
VRPATDSRAGFIGGFVAAEGTFTGGAFSNQVVFRFAVGLGATDAGMCEFMLEFFGVGHIWTSPRRKAHYDDEVTYAVQSQSDLIEVIVPFMDEHLPDSYKRLQYLDWRERLVDYWEHRARRRRPCSVEGCDAPRRAHGYCRHHLWVMRGQ